MLPVSGPAVVAHAKGDLRVEEVPLAAPAPDEAVVEVRYGGICGSDLHYWLHGAAGESILKAPLVLGHEISGVVVRAAADGTGPAAGTPVAVHPATPGPGAGDVRYPADRPNLSPGCTYLGSRGPVPAHRRRVQPVREPAGADAAGPAGEPGPAHRGADRTRRPWPGTPWPGPGTSRARPPW